MIKKAMVAKKSIGMTPITYRLGLLIRRFGFSANRGGYMKVYWLRPVGLTVRIFDPLKTNRWIEEE